jgi:hypothetical protein
MPFNTQQLTLNNIIEYLAALCAHKQVHSFFYGPVWDLDVNKDIQYPLFAVVPQPSIIHPLYIELKLRLYIIDQIEPSDTNRFDVHSDAFQVLLDYKAYIYKDFSTYLLPGDDADITPLWEDFDDYVGGWYMDLPLKFDNIGNVCDIPGLVLTGATSVQAGSVYNINLTNYLPIAGGTMTGPFNTISTISSGGTNLYNIFATLSQTGSTSGGSSNGVIPGTNITTGGTAASQIVSTVASPIFNNETGSGTSTWNAFSSSTISGGTINSGSTNLYNIFMQGQGIGVMNIIPGSNIVTGGTQVSPIVSTVASPSFLNTTVSGTGTYNALTATTISATTYVNLPYNYAYIYLSNN